MSFFPLDIFPETSLASSVITTVWVGVLVVGFFNLRFGWVLSGLVVPGYLVPLLLTKPWSAGIVVLEAIITYLLVHGFSERLSRLGYWSSLFGRDRFFALILVSVIVRLVFDGWLLPLAGAYWQTHIDGFFDYRNNLQSFGLIIISLLANQFWKPGLGRGLLGLGVTVGLTYLIVRYGLMELTNFTISRIGYLYEDLAFSVLASPKAYIILLTTAFVASRMNLRYGWDFNGILIPSLLALQWYQPGKILTSFAEAILILVIAKLLLRMRPFNRMNIEGARKLIFFFNIGFAYKILLGYTLPVLAPEWKVTDAFGFGYLLSTLIAIRMHDQHTIARLLRATLQTSLSAALIASVVGFALTLIPQLGSWSGSLQTTPAEYAVKRVTEPLDTLLQNDLIRLYQPATQHNVLRPLASEINAFENAVILLQQASPPQQRTAQEGTAAGLLAQAHYELWVVSGRYYYLREREPARGWGTYLLDRTLPQGLLLSLPAPLEEPLSASAALPLLRTLQIRALAIGGSPLDANTDGSADVLRYPQSLFQAFHRVLPRNNTLQLRTSTGSYADALWVKGFLPDSLELSRLRPWLTNLALQWATPDTRNRQRELYQGGFAELYLRPTELRSALARNLAPAAGPTQVSGPLAIDAYLRQALREDNIRLAARGTDAYRAPSATELHYLDRTVFTPLARLLADMVQTGPLLQYVQDSLQVIAAAAQPLGYRLSQYTDQRSGEQFLILSERLSRDAAIGPPRFWGTYVFRLGQAAPYLLEIPRPLLEQNTLEYGLDLFERLQARVALLAGAHPEANLDNSANLTAASSPASVFNLVNEVFLREAGAAPWLAISTRAFANQPEHIIEADALLSYLDSDFGTQLSSPLTAQVLELLQADGMQVRPVQGDPATAGYEALFLPQVRYLAATRNKGFMTLWLSPQLRASYRDQTDYRVQVDQFQALGLAVLNADLLDYAAPRVIAAPLPEALLDAVLAYIDSADIVLLDQLQREWPTWQPQYLLDTDSGMAFLLLSDSTGHLGLIAQLAPRNMARKVSPLVQATSAIADFKQQQQALLYFQD